MLTTKIKAIIQYLRSTFSKKVKVDNCNVLDYYQTKYSIWQLNDGSWQIVVTLFSEGVDGGFINIPLEATNPSPETIFFFLQLLGPLFINTNEIVTAYNHTGKVYKEWNLKKTPQEQGIDIEIEIIKPLRPNTNIINEGPTSIN